MHSRHAFSRLSRIVVPVVILTALAAACAPAAPPSPTAAPPKPAAQPTAAPAKPAEAPKPAATTAPAKPAATTAPAKPAEAKPAASPAAKTEAKPAASPATAAISLPKPEKTSVKVGFPTFEANSYLFKFAEEMGIYRKYGIEKAEVIFFESSARLTPAHVAGEIDFASNSSGPVLSSLVTGSPQVVAAMFKNKLADDLVTSANIKTAADLKGKNVAVGGFGADAHAAALLAIKELGLKESDVVMQSIGGQSARLAALKGGSAAAAPVDEALRDEMKKEGFNILVQLADSPQEFARSGLVFTQEFFQKNPSTALAATAALLEARQVLHTRTREAIEGYARFIQAKDAAQAEKDMRLFMEKNRRDLRWSKAAFDNLLEVSVTVNPALKDVDVTKAYTFALLDKLRDMGFNDAVGVPKS
jgi:ABC-type nitrate/sulfonate/bicarbonate transport system substrate-binding protein